VSKIFQGKGRSASSGGGATTVIGLVEVENQDHPFVEGTWRRYRSHQGLELGAQELRMNGGELPRESVEITRAIRS
jgi:hypothetical protein